MKEKLKRKNDFRVSLHNTIEYFHKICDKARANVFKSLLFKASCQLKPNAFLELLSQCQKATDETKAYELLNLVKNIISLDVPLDRNELEQLMGIYEMLKLKSVRITLLLLDIFVILEEKELIKITLLLQIEIIKTKIPEEVLNEEFLVDVLKRAQKMPAFFPLACYALAVHPDKLQAVFIKNIPTVCDEYKRVNKAWPFWPSIAAIICGGRTMNTILEFVLRVSTKIWETVYVILEITSKLLNSTSTEPQRQFFTIMSTLVKENDPNELVFEKLCFTYIFTWKGQTHNKAIINEIVNSKLETFVDKSFLAEVKKEAEKFDVSLFNKFESRLLKLWMLPKVHL